VHGSHVEWWSGEAVCLGWGTGVAHWRRKMCERLDVVWVEGEVVEVGDLERKVNKE